MLIDPIEINAMGYKITNLILLSCLNGIIASGRSYYASSEYIVVSECFFSRTSVFNGNGGVICIEGTGNLNASSCVFYKCCVSQSLSNMGGAIFFSARSIMLDKVCGQYCTSYHGHFAWIASQDGFDNHVYYGTISKCSDQFTYYCPFRIMKGKQVFLNTNITSNGAKEVPGTTYSGATSLSVSYSTFAANHASHSRIIELYGDSSILRSLSFINIIGNTQTENLFGIVYGDYSGQCSISNSIFQSNSNTLFYIKVGSMSILDCNIAHSYTLKFGAVDTIENKFGTYPLHSLIHYATAMCQAEYTMYQITQARFVQWRYIQAFISWLCLY